MCSVCDWMRQNSWLWKCRPQFFLTINFGLNWYRFAQSSTLRACLSFTLCVRKMILTKTRDKIKQLVRYYYYYYIIIIVNIIMRVLQKSRSCSSVVNAIVIIVINRSSSQSSLLTVIAIIIVHATMTVMWHRPTLTLPSLINRRQSCQKAKSPQNARIHCCLCQKVIETPKKSRVTKENLSAYQKHEQKTRSSSGDERPERDIGMRYVAFDRSTIALVWYSSCVKRPQWRVPLGRSP